MPRPLNFPQKSFPEPFKLDRVARIEAKNRGVSLPYLALMLRKPVGGEAENFVSCFYI